MKTRIYAAPAVKGLIRWIGLVGARILKPSVAACVSCLDLAQLHLRSQRKCNGPLQ